ncbi:MAG: SRPBCC family protein [Bacteroidota bacterium]
MKVYKLERFQFLPISIDHAWNFFSSPKNLKEITPKYMKFIITYISGKEKMYADQLISYIVNILPGLPVRWTTEITHVNEPLYFIDEQRFGPYALWPHQHHFKAVDSGVEMTDIVNYAIPLGIFGRFTNWLFVSKKVRAIFDYRFEVLEKKFKK